LKDILGFAEADMRTWKAWKKLTHMRGSVVICWLIDFAMHEPEM
jgi:hypothetical protein